MQPRGTVTLLFTDIEGSTRLLTALGKDRYSLLLARHCVLLREAFARYGGYEVDTEGDAFFVAFSTARDAVLAAGEAQDLLDAEGWPDGSVVRVRMGIHTGEPLVAEPKYVGLHVHRAARIGASAHGGQVLLSPTTADLVAGELPPGLALRNLGSYQLKDFEASVQLFQLDRGGIAHDFGHLRTAVADASPLDLGPRRLRSSKRLIAAVIGVVLLPVIAVALLIGRTHGNHGLNGLSTNAVAAVDASTGKLIASVPLGAPPGAIAVGSGSVWVANADDLLVWRIDRAQKQVVATIPLAAKPTAIATLQGAVWVASDDGRLRRIDPVFNRVTKTIKLGARPVPAIAIVGQGRTLWVANADATVSRVDTVAERLAARIDVGSAPSAITLGFGSVWVTNRADDTVSRIDMANVVTATIPVGDAPAAVASDGSGVWVADARSIARIEPSSNAIAARLRLASTPIGLVAQGGRVWATTTSGDLVRVDAKTTKLAATIHADSGLHTVIPDGTRLWIGVSPSGKLAVSSAATLRLGGEDVGPLDPATTDSPGGQELEYATCAKLLNYPDAAGPKGARLVPELAASYPRVSDGGRTYTFTIRAGWEFSPPSNAPVTAETLAYTIRRALNPKLRSYPAIDGLMDDIQGAPAYIAGRAKNLAGVTAQGNRLIIRLSSPSGSLPARLATPWFCAVPNDTPMSRNIARIPTAGPYYVAAYTAGHLLTLARNPNYHGGRARRPRTILYTQGLNEDNAITRITAGTLDYQLGSAYTVAQTQRAMKASHRRTSQRPHFSISSYLDVHYLFFNTSRSAFSLAQTRIAANYALDRDADDRLWSGSVFGSRELTDSYLPPTMPGYVADTTYPLSHSDAAKGRELMQGRSVAATLYTSNDSTSRDEAQLIKSELAEIGIVVTVVALPDATFFQRIDNPKEPYDLALLTEGADYADPADLLNVLFDGKYSAQHPTFGGTNYFPATNYSRFNSPLWNRRLESADRLTGSARYKAYGKLSVALAKAAAPAAALESWKFGQLFSARTACEIEQPVYSVDVAALCIKR